MALTTALSSSVTSLSITSDESEVNPIAFPSTLEKATCTRLAPTMDFEVIWAITRWLNPMMSESD